MRVRAMADYTPSPRAIRAVAVLVRIGHRAWLAALAGYVVLVLILGLPHSPELGPLETPVQIGLLGAGLVGGAIAFRSVPVGGVVLVFGAVALGVMASLRYPPMLAFVAVAPFFVPGIAYVAAWIVGAAPRMTVTASVVLVVLFAGGGFAAGTVHDHYHGAAHPQSEREALAESAVSWVWSGGITPDSAVVVAQVEPGSLTRLVIEPADAGPFGPVVADDEGVVRFDLSGLSSSTNYRYIVEVGGTRDEVRAGSLTTVTTDPMSFTVAAGSCARSSSNGMVFEAIRQAEPTLFLITGDIHYGNFVEGDP
ncbi:MAG: hypothetical protein HKO87_08050, partial [Acidimicrobiia bacterium]|nr:hypothetical protein [Acidimicrobiia bacterium]